MMKSEFEAIAKRTVTNEEYQAIEALYMASDLDKHEFVKSIKGLLKSMPEADKRPVKIINVHNMYFEYTTPNRCYYLTYKAWLDNVDIKTGKAYWTIVPGTFELRYDYDHRVRDDRDIIKGLEAE